VAIEAGALDVEVADDGSTIEVYTEPGNTESVREALVAAGFTVENADLAKVPQNTVELDEPTAIATLKLLERLDDLDDVSKVHSNADFPDSVLEAAAG
jgi:transcriptional/translational regulatory protein YebC/TACO1